MASCILIYYVWHWANGLHCNSMHCNVSEQKVWDLVRFRVNCKIVECHQCTGAFTGGRQTSPQTGYSLFSIVCFNKMQLFIYDKNKLASSQIHKGGTFCCFRCMQKSDSSVGDKYLPFKPRYTFRFASPGVLTNYSSQKVITYSYCT